VRFQPWGVRTIAVGDVVQVQPAHPAAHGQKAATKNQRAITQGQIGSH